MNLGIIFEQDELSVFSLGFPLPRPIDWDGLAVIVEFHRDVELVWKNAEIVFLCVHPDFVSFLRSEQRAEPIFFDVFVVSQFENAPFGRPILGTVVFE